jgi:GT2 family glycosyltransferase
VTAGANQPRAAASAGAEAAAGAGARPALTVIVPVYNGRLQLPRCLEALRRSEFADFEVIVVDDCSTDNTREIAERSGARYLRTPRNLGPGGGRNLGVRHARAEVVVFVDADVVVAATALGYIAEDFVRSRELAAVFGSYDEKPAWPDFLSQYKNLMHYYVHQQSSERAVTFWAGCGAVRKSVFEEFGGFNTKKYPNPSIEDIELGTRLALAGRNILLDKRVYSKHLKRWTVRGLWQADIHYRAIPWTNLILETKRMPVDLNLTRAAQVSSGLVGLVVAGLLLLPVTLADAFARLMPWLTPLRVAAGLAAAATLILALNWRVYLWFARQRGLNFAAGAVLAHWAYYFYCGVVFALCWLNQRVLGRALTWLNAGLLPAEDARSAGGGTTEAKG